MEIQCPICEKPFTVSEQHYNQEVNCPYCSQSLFLEEQSTISNEDSESKEAAKRARIRNIILDSLPKYLINPDAFTAIEKLSKREELNPDELLSLGKFTEAKKRMLDQSSKELNLNKKETDNLKRLYDETFHLINPDAFIAYQLEKNPDYFEEITKTKKQKNDLIKEIKRKTNKKFMQTVVKNILLPDSEPDAQRAFYNDTIKSKWYNEYLDSLIKEKSPHLYEDHEQTDWVGLREKVDEFVELKNFVKESKGAKIVLIAIAVSILLMIYLIY